MRLLNTTTLKLHYFVADIPDYVILSHTWGEEEVLFEDIDKPNVSGMAGYAKILKCCQQGKYDGFEWAWVDTCCIDKRSSAELTEAINSMYKWYWEAATCYAYLADATKLHDDLERSRWFTRGWTLQELLAPGFVEFYAHGWRRLGSRTKLVDRLVRATNIDKRFLLDRKLISGASIATKFSWASLRQTTRAEDMAYCLLGLVDVNMPMLYGEGHKAFYRLQLEIIKHRNEHTIFAWNSHNLNSQLYSTTILAPSPAAFEFSAHFLPVTSHRPAATLTYEMTSNGLRLNLPCVAISQERMIAVFDCENERSDRLGIWLERSEGHSFRRLLGSDISHMKTRDLDDAEFQEFYVEAIAQPTEQERHVTHMLDVTPFPIHSIIFMPAISVGGFEKLSIKLVEDEFIWFHMGSHRWFQPKFIHRDSSALVVGLHKGYPTLRAVRLFNERDRFNNIRKTILSSDVQRRLALENPRYVRDYYRVALCCGNVLDVALRRTKGADHICWKAEIAVEDPAGDLLRSLDEIPSSCNGGMAIDVTLDDLCRET